MSALCSYGELLKVYTVTKLIICILYENEILVLHMSALMYIKFSYDIKKDDPFASLISPELPVTDGPSCPWPVFNT